MYRFVGVFFLTGLLGLTYITSNDETSATGRKAAQPAPLTDNEASRSVEHVLHLRTHKRQEVEPDRSRKEEASQPSRGSGSAQCPPRELMRLQPDRSSAAERRPGLPRARTRRRKRGSRRRALNSASAEIEAPQPRGFFESLFNSN